MRDREREREVVRMIKGRWDARSLEREREKSQYIKIASGEGEGEGGLWACIVEECAL